MPFLIKFKKDWADEFDVHGIRVLSNEQWNKLKEAIENVKYPLEIYFGTNEDFVFTNSQDTLRELNVTEIEDCEADIFKQHFGNKFGWDPIDQILEFYYEDQK